MVSLNKIGYVKIVIWRLIKDENTWQRRHKMWEGINTPNTLEGIPHTQK